MRDTRRQPAPHAHTYEAEVIPGLEAIAQAELRERFGERVFVQPTSKEGLLEIKLVGQRAALLDLKTVLAVYERRLFAIPRPKALLGQAAFDELIDMIDTIRALHSRGAFATFRISAAGEESAVMVRLRDQLAARTGLTFTAEEGDLLLRLRRPLDRSDGWDVLIRLSPRPLATRPWRVCNRVGALNGSAAHAMACLSQPDPDDVVLNLGCGSASLLIERLAAAPARLAIGCDVDPDALACARENVAASGFDQIKLFDWDVTALPTPDGWVDVVLADLPFGQLVGSHAINVHLYPRLLREATRVTVGGGLFVSITQEIRLWERLIADAAADWTTLAVLPIKLPSNNGYVYPRIYVLQRKAELA